MRNGPACMICDRPRQKLETVFRDEPCGHCAALAEHADDYFHIPKLFTWPNVARQLSGFRQLARGLYRTLRGGTPVAKTHGRVGGLTACIRIWLDLWEPHRQRGWVRMRSVYLYANPFTGRQDSGNHVTGIYAAASPRIRTKASPEDLQAEESVG